MATQSVFIKWTTTEQIFKDWRYVGGGSYDPTFETKKITKRLRYSAEVNDEMIERAKSYVKSDMSDYENVKVVVEND